MQALESSLPLLDDPRAPTAKDDRPGCGCLMVERAGRRLALPLRSVSFAATVVERTAEVTVEQVFENGYAELLEAVYIFPLSGNAAVSRFELHVGGKQLVGLVEERGEARRQYQVALAEGRRAALLEQERDDVFTVKVGNLPPRERATIKLVYAERLPAFDDGETELRIPLVVAPRYVPGEPLERPSMGEGTESDTTAVPDASRITPPRLAPGLRGDVALEIAVSLLGESEVQDLGCTQHATRLGVGSGRLTVKLAKKDELLDRDFVLRWKSAGTTERPVLYVTRRGERAYGLLSLVPPRNVAAGAGARDVLFLLDRSGSMEGAKIDSARRAIDALLGTLAPQDRFGIVAFDDAAEWFGRRRFIRRTDHFPQADAGAIADARTWLAGVGTRGGTQLVPALDESLAALDELAASADARERLRIVVLVTDGQVGNESEILRRVEARAEGLRVFTLGIDSAVNAAFLRRLAQIGRGTATLCAPGAELEHALARIGKEVGAPVLVDLAVEDQGLGIEGGTLTPERLPDLYAGRTASIFFRCSNASGSVRIRARRASGGAFDQVVAAETVELAALPLLWAKSRVSDLEDRYRVAYGGETGGLEAARGEILDLALEHQLLTRFTAFIVVDRDEATRRLAIPRRRVVQAVEQPAGWAQGEAAKSGVKACPNGHVMEASWSVCPSCPAPGKRRRAPMFPMRMGVTTHTASPPMPPSAASADKAPLSKRDVDDSAADAFAPPRAGAAPNVDALDGKALGHGGMGSVSKMTAQEALDAGFVTMDELTGAPASVGDAFAPPPASGAGGALPPPPPASAPAPAPASTGKSGGWFRSSKKESAPPPSSLASAPANLPAPPTGQASFGGRDANLTRAGAAPSLEGFVEALGKELARVLAELEQARWPADRGAGLGFLRDQTVRALLARGFEAKTPRLRELLTVQFVRVLEVLRAAKGAPADEALGLVRAVSEALAAQARAELAPLLGKTGAFWEASI